MVEVARFGLIQNKKLLKCCFGSDDGWLTRVVDGVVLVVDGVVLVSGGVLLLCVVMVMVEVCGVVDMVDVEVILHVMFTRA